MVVGLVPFSADPASIRLISGFRQSFLLILSLLRGEFSPASKSTQLTLVSPGSSTEQPPANQIVEQILKFRRALLLANLEIGEQVVLQLIKCARLLQLPPDGRRDAVEPVAMARIRIERDKLITDIGGQQIGRTFVVGLIHDADFHELAGSKPY